MAYLRVMLIVALFSLLTVGAIFLGYQRRSVVVTHFHENLGKIYPLAITDMDHSIRLPLARTRCFDAVPTLYYRALREAGVDLSETGRWYSRVDEVAWAAVERLKCASNSHAVMYHYP